MPTPSFKGQKTLQTQSSSFNANSFHIRQELLKLNTTTVVKVEAVHVESRISEVGYVDVRPQIDQMDGQGNPVPHVIIYNVPFIRIQGGKNAFIIDPQVGDIGMCNFSDRDISRFKENKEPSLPGSKRLMNMADGLYTGGLLNGTPERYVLIDDDGIEIEGKALVHIHATSVTIDAETIDVTASDRVTIVATNIAEITADFISLTATTLLDIVSPLTKISGVLDVAGNILAKASIVLTGGIAAPGGAPASATAGFDVNGKVIDDNHGHGPGSYAAGGDAVSGSSGGVS